MAGHVRSDGFTVPRTARELGIMQGFPPPPEKIPTASNWDLAPFNRHTFLNVRSFVPTVDVRADPAAGRPLPRGERDVADLTFLARDGTVKTVAQMLAETYTDGFIALSHGRVVTEQYFNDMTPATLHLSQSVAKSVVGILAGVLWGEGLLDPSAPLTEYVPELARCGYLGATVGDVLDMQSGVRFVEEYADPESDIGQLDIASGWKPAPPHYTGPTTLRDQILGLRQTRPHGEVFEYRSIETDVLAWAMERAAGQGLADLLSDRIWTRIGAERDASFTVDRAGTALADGGFNATLRDYARFALMVAAGGQWDGRRIVPEAWVEDIARCEPAKFRGDYRLLAPNGAYRRKWWVMDADHGDFTARGIFGQMIYIDRSTDFVAVKLSTWPDYLIPAFTADALAGMRAIRDICR
ncbi:serine hydrolase domain-containing protein [Albidovulum sediminis]|uniref:Beta-lactamase family protein n=1 Tax=Albidovulum sediminis TaxID=3066345 RepID=A0ABT2NGQ8_9RHOB|nr:serine hydrolase [Defluviimonas sediminis]MCT8328103.1 beta-lactamase family protein [Defluviimonas sediminis]